jgi:hypothetical protein
VSVIRDFRPHVIVAVFSGTPRDGHGHHQVSGLLAREAFDLAGDGARMPPNETHGRAPWTPLKFYRSTRFNGAGASTYRFDVGEYSPLRGESYAEIAAESRSQHKSQAFGSLHRKGVMMDGVRLEASHVGMPAPGTMEQSLFEGIDTTWTRVARESGHARAAVDSLPGAIMSAQRAYDPFAPDQLLPELARVRRLATEARGSSNPDAEASISELVQRVNDAIRLASGIGVDAVVDHETWAAEEPILATVTVYDRISQPMNVAMSFPGQDGKSSVTRGVSALSSVQFIDTLRDTTIAQPWWLARPRAGDIFGTPIIAKPEDERHGLAARVSGDIGGVAFDDTIPVVFRYADPVKGEIRHPIAIVPAVSVTLDQPVQYVPANRPFERVVRVELRSASNHARTVRISLALPRGLAADSTSRTIGLPDYAGNFGGEGEPQAIGGGRSVSHNSPSRTVEFHVHGTLPAGTHIISATAESEGKRYTDGYTLVEYDHIRPQRLFRDARIELSAVDVVVPRTLAIAYVRGVGDNVAPMLEQLGIPVTVIAPEKLGDADLSHFTTIVVGPRAYESSPALVAANPKLFEFARNGGTVVVQYGQFEMANPGMMPYPITIERPGDRVTEEDAPVRVIDPSSAILSSPNQIGPEDWQGWVQERSLYMPHTHDEHYRTMLSMNDTGEQPNDGAILVAPLGKGTYVYTTLSLFRQLPAGVPGGARLFVNLLSADQRTAGGPPTAPRP